jgi:hypothetical protein
MKKKIGPIFKELKLYWGRKEGNCTYRLTLSRVSRCLQSIPNWMRANATLVEHLHSLIFSGLFGLLILVARVHLCFFVSSLDRSWNWSEDSPIRRFLCEKPFRVFAIYLTGFFVHCVDFLRLPACSQLFIWIQTRRKNKSCLSEHKNRSLSSKSQNMESNPVQSMLILHSRIYYTERTAEKQAHVTSLLRCFGPRID